MNEVKKEIERLEVLVKDLKDLSIELESPIAFKLNSLLIMEYENKIDKLKKES